MSRALVATAMLVLAGCGGSVKPLQIDIRSAQPWAKGPDTADRKLAVAAAAATWWGGSISDLDGWTLIVTDPPVADAMDDDGLTVPAEHRIEVDTRYGPCVEAAPIPHEIGHAILFITSRDPDGGHHDPRWRLIRPAGAQFCNERPRADDLEQHDSDALDERRSE